MTMTVFDRVLKYNMALTFVRAVLGETVGFMEEYDAAGIFHADELLEGIEEPRT